MRFFLFQSTVNGDTLDPVHFSESPVSATMRGLCKIHFLYVLLTCQVMYLNLEFTQCSKCKIILTWSCNTGLEVGFHIISFVSDTASTGPGLTTSTWSTAPAGRRTAATGRLTGGWAGGWSPPSSGVSSWPGGCWERDTGHALSRALSYTQTCPVPCKY